MMSLTGFPGLLSRFHPQELDAISSKKMKTGAIEAMPPGTAPGYRLLVHHR